MAKQIHTFHGFDRPDVEVLVDDTWWPGELRQWTQHDDDTWHGNVTYRDADGQRSATFPADRIRLDTIDRSHGRTVPVDELSAHDAI